VIGLEETSNPKLETLRKLETTTPKVDWFRAL
jgi:hypothetical protein